MLVPVNSSISDIFLAVSLEACYEVAYRALPRFGGRYDFSIFDGDIYKASFVRWAIKKASRIEKVRRKMANCYQVRKWWHFPLVSQKAIAFCNYLDCINRF
ncbi:MAG: hypothetical protein WBB28_01180 [Crinalium sp.]